MRVNVLAQPSNSNAEPTANSRDCAENNPAGGFFAQIDQIWNQNKAADAAGGEKRTGQDEPKAETDPLTMMTGVSLIPENPQPPFTKPGLSGDLSSEEKRADRDEARAETDPLTMMTGVSLIPENPQPPFTKPGLPGDLSFEEKRADRDEARAETDPLTMMTGVSLIPGKPQPPVTQPGLPGDFSSQLQPAAPSVQAFEQTNVPIRIVDKTSMAALFVKEAGNLLDAFALSESKKPTIGAFNSAGDSSIPASGDSISEQKTSPNPPKSDFGLERSQSSASQRALDPSTSIAAVEPSKSSPDATLVARAALEHSRNLSQRADASAATDRVELPDSLRMSVEPDKAGDAVPVAVQSKSGNIITRATLENAGTDNSHADRENSSNEGVSWTVQPSRLANAQKDSTKAASSIAERPADVASQMAASPVRLADAGAPAMPGAAEATASKPREFIFQLADRIQVQLRDGKGEIRIQLQPDSLGHLEIRAESTVNGVVARIVAESSSIKNYLETNLHLLQQSLQDQGLKVDRIQVSVQDNSGFNSFAGYAAQSGHPGPGPQGRGNGRSSASGILSVEPLEELAVDPLTWVSLNPNIRFHTVA